jgi:hypothetical protein
VRFQRNTVLEGEVPGEILLAFWSCVCRHALLLDIVLAVEGVPDIGSRRSAARFQTYNVVPTLGPLGRDDDRRTTDREIIDQGIPVLPICEKQEIAAAGAAEDRAEKVYEHLFFSVTVEVDPAVYVASVVSASDLHDLTGVVGRYVQDGCFDVLVGRCFERHLCDRLPA